MKKNKLILDKKDISNIIGDEYSKLLDIFSDKFGIVNAILERHELDKYDLYMYQCLSADTRKLFDISRDVSSGGLGVNEDKRIAITSCLAEALERYCMSYIPKKEIVFCKRNEFKESEVLPDYSTYTKEQYSKFNVFSNPYADEIGWTKITRFDGKKKVYWPASLIYLPYDAEKPIAETTSTGMAAGFTLDECILSGLMELIERDALMINFMKRLDPPEIDLNTITGKNKEFIDRIKKEYEIKVYKLYTDSIAPVYLSIIYNQSKKIHYGIGACASLDSDYAINKSLKECLFTYFYSLNIMDARQKNPDKINTLYEHFLYYQEENFAKLLFNSKRIAYARQQVTLEEVVNQLRKNKIDVYYKDLTTSDIKDTGIKVVKVVAPSLIDLNKSHIYPRLGAARYNIVPKKLKLKTDEGITPLPHPFP